jgi:predicted amidohydrolase
VVDTIERGRREGCRVVVFPESMLQGAADHADIERAMTSVRQAAAGARVYVLIGAVAPDPGRSRGRQFMEVIDPDGRVILHYDKLYDRRDATNPGVFLIDGIPAHAIICADRWLRGVEELPITQGAQLSFELSDNFENEWLDALEWYWYVPRAIRNNVWVVFCNSANPAGAARDKLVPQERKHGHSAVIAPSGQVVAAARDDAERLLTAVIDPQAASRREALARAEHATLRSFWEAGSTILGGGPDF